MIDRTFLGSFASTVEDILIKTSAAKGHWRKLEPGEVGEGRFGEKTPGKTWVDREESRKSVAAKKQGHVPPPQPVGMKGDFIAFAVPGGNFLFIIHKDSAKEFMSLTRKEDWVKDPKVKAFMMDLGSQGKLGIYKVGKTPIGY